MTGIPKREASLVSFLVTALLAIDVYATYSILTSRYPGANDFYSRWKGAEVFWKQGVDPYSDQATLAIQKGIYGRPAQPGEDPGPFAYPFYTAFVLAPVVWLPYSWAEAIWLVVLEVSLVGGVLLCLSLYKWRMPGWLAAVTVLWVLVFYHSARTILLGQFAGLVFLWTAGTLWMLARKHDVMAGVLLALTTIKPQMSFLLVPALLLWGVGQRRWRFVGGLGGAMALLFGASFVLLPGWLAGFLGQLMHYTSYTAIGSPVWILSQYYFPFLGTPVEIGLAALLVIYLLFRWVHLPQAQETSGEFYWILGTTLIVTNLVAVRTATTNYVILYIPLFFALKLAADRLRNSKQWLAVFYLVSVIGGWLLFLATVEGKFEHPIMYLPLPIGLFVAFVVAKQALQKASVRTQPVTPGRA
jgi:hypothetical protein